MGARVSEFDLGLPEPERREPRTPAPGVTWQKVNPRVNHLCDDCVDETPKIKGVPIHAISPAYFVRRENGVNAYYCSTHGQERKQAEKG